MQSLLTDRSSPSSLPGLVDRFPGAGLRLLPLGIVQRHTPILPIREFLQASLGTGTVRDAEGAGPMRVTLGLVRTVPSEVLRELVGAEEEAV